VPPHPAAPLRNPWSAHSGTSPAELNRVRGWTEAAGVSRIRARLMPMQAPLSRAWARMSETDTSAVGTPAQMSEKAAPFPRTRAHVSPIRARVALVRVRIGRRRVSFPHIRVPMNEKGRAYHADMRANEGQPCALPGDARVRAHSLERNASGFQSASSYFPDRPEKSTCSHGKTDVLASSLNRRSEPYGSRTDARAMTQRSPSKGEAESWQANKQKARW
jgi:hypothetical protein